MYKLKMQKPRKYNKIIKRFIITFFLDKIYFYYIFLFSIFLIF